MTAYNRQFCCCSARMGKAGEAGTFQGYLSRSQSFALFCSPLSYHMTVTSRCFSPDIL